MIASNRRVAKPMTNASAANPMNAKAVRTTMPATPADSANEMSELTSRDSEGSTESQLGLGAGSPGKSDMRCTRKDSEQVRNIDRHAYRHERSHRAWAYSDRIGQRGARFIRRLYLRSAARSLEFI